MIWIGLVIIVLTFVAIIKKWETRACLFIAGLLMCLLSGNPLAAIDAFTKALVNSFLVPIIACAMGFAYVINMTGCDKHFSYLALLHVIKIKAFLVPLAVLVIWIFSIAINSPAGLAAAVAPIIIPVLIRAGVHPAMAAATVLLGTWGEFVSIASSLMAVVGSISHTDVPSIVLMVLPGSLAGLVVSCLGLWVISIFRKEDKGYTGPAEDVSTSNADLLEEVRSFKVNYLKALMPILPIVLLILGTDQVGWIMKFTVPQAMILCTMLTLLVSWMSPFEAMRKFCSGMGEGFASIAALIAAAGVFTAGMNALGMIDSLIEVMKSSQHIAKIAASWGTFIIAALSGSGDAACLAFNTSITPHAAAMGLDPNYLGAAAYMGAALGRTLSPVAGVTLICASVAKVDPMDLTKRVWLAVVATNLVGMIVVQYILA